MYDYKLCIFFSLVLIGEVRIKMDITDGIQPAMSTLQKRGKPIL